jgi:manganese efflux pump family protein
MSILEIILIGIGLSMDCFAVAVSFGTNRLLYGRYIFRTALFFGLFQGLMPIAGWLIGDSMKVFIESFDHWIALVILGFIGIKMIVQSFADESKENPVDIRKTTVLVSLSVATSIDALITGVSFGFIRVNILLAASLITGITFLSTILGALIGRRTTFLPARWAERIGGMVLILIGLKIVWVHLGFF